MRQPTLHEKITIKGILERRGVNVRLLAAATTFTPLLFSWRMCVGRPIADYARCY